MHNAFFETHNTLSSVEPLFSLFVKYYDNLCLAFIVYVYSMMLELVMAFSCIVYISYIYKSECLEFS